MAALDDILNQAYGADNGATTAPLPQTTTSRPQGDLHNVDSVLDDAYTGNNNTSFSMKDQILGLASGLLKSGATIGDLGYKAGQVLQGNIEGFKQSPILDTLNEYLDSQGLDSIDKQAPDTLGHHIGEVAPLVALGGEGLIPIALRSIFSGAGGDIGSNIGETLDKAHGTQYYKPVLDTLGSVIGLGIPSSAGKGAVSIFSNPLTPEQATLQAFKADSKAIPAFNALKANGTITPDILQSNTPYNDLKDLVSTQIHDHSENVTSLLQDAPVSTAAVLPSRETLMKSENFGKLSQSDIGSIINKERGNLAKDILANLDPANADTVDQQYRAFLRNGKAAQNGDVGALLDYSATRNQLESYPLDGNDLWNIRQRYDDNINWNDPAGTTKSKVYLALRADLSNQLRQVGGQPLEDSFEHISNLKTVQPYIDNMADLESQGKTLQSPIGQKVLSTVTSPVKTIIKDFVGGIDASPKPSSVLPAAFGQTLAQRLKFGSALPPLGASLGLGSVGLNNVFDHQDQEDNLSPRQTIENIEDKVPSSSNNTPSEAFIQSNIISNIFNQLTKGGSNALNDDNSKNNAFFLGSNKMSEPDDTIAQIKSDPYYHALALTESSFNPEATNSKSTAKGLFQFTDPTAKSLGLHDPTNIPDSFKAVQKLTKSNSVIIGRTDPTDLYGAHVLGAPLYKKVLKRTPLNSKDQQNVDTFYNTDLPNFEKNYAMISSNNDQV